jgi:hypothetical protein
MPGVPLYLLILFVVLGISVLAWFALVNALYARLSANHAEKFREMGEPALFQSPNSTYVLMRFILRRKDRPLRDAQLSRLTGAMFVFFICYTVLLVFCMVRVVSLSPLFSGSNQRLERP